ncbi:MAG TPA: DUF2269 family protein [Baekduia sp.]|nr:DUF2269 family protein [Baekduia sp.]
MTTIKALHVIAAFAAYGLPFAYPLFIPYLRRHHPRTLPGVHDVQHRLNLVLTGPGTVALLAFGIYLATKDHQWGETYVNVGIAILAVIVVAGGMIVRWTAELSQLAQTDVARARDDATVAFSPAYERTYRRYLVTETALGALVLVAIFFMVAKP